MAQLRHRLGLDLTDALARHAVDLADLVESLRLTVTQAKTHRHNAGFTLRQRVQDVVELFLQQGEGHGVCGNDGLGVLDEVTELGVAVLTERRVQRNRLATILLNLHDLLGGHVEFLRQFLGGRFATQVLEHLALDTRKLVNDLDHVHRDADRTRLVRHRAGDRLTNPPGGVGRELVALRIIELFDGADEAQVALLDQVQELHTAPGVALGQRHNESKVRLEQVVLRLLTVLSEEVQLATLAAGHLVSLVLQLVLGVEAGFDTPGEVHFLLRIQQRDLTDLLEVVLHRVSRCTGNRHLLDGFVGLIGIGDDEATLHVDTIVRTFTKCGALSELRILFVRFVLCIGFVVDGVGLEFGILKVLTSRLELYVNRVIEFLDDLLDDGFFLLLATARLLRGGLLRALPFGGGLLRRLLSSRLLRGRLLGGLCGTSSLLRGSLLRRGLLRGRLLLLGGSVHRVDRASSLLGARSLLRGGLHLRGFLSRRGVLCRSARCTHTGPFH